MYITGFFQMRGVNSRLLNRLGDIRINPGKFVFTDGNIDASQKVDGFRHRLPVKCRILGDIESQILIQRLNCLLRSALRISIVNLIIRVFVIYIQISVPEYGNQIDLTGFEIDAANHVYVCIGSLSDVHLAADVSGIHTETGNCHIALHSFYLGIGKLRVFNLFFVKLNFLK